LEPAPEHLHFATKQKKLRLVPNYFAHWKLKDFPPEEEGKNSKKLVWLFPLVTALKLD
jgi:hypothetical protein